MGGVVVSPKIGTPVSAGCCGGCRRGSGAASTVYSSVALEACAGPFINPTPSCLHQFNTCLHQPNTTNSKPYTIHLTP